MLHKRPTTPESKIFWGTPFRLGRAGVPITIAAMLYSMLGIFFSFWLAYVDVNATSVNYSSLILWKRVDIQPWLLGSVRKKGLHWAYHGNRKIGTRGER